MRMPADKAGSAWVISESALAVLSTVVGYYVHGGKHERSR